MAEYDPKPKQTKPTTITVTQSITWRKEKQRVRLEVIITIEQEMVEKIWYQHNMIHQIG
jgi:hypothetical protein